MSAHPNHLDPMTVAVHFDDSESVVMMVNVAFDCLSGPTMFVTSLAQLDDLVAALTAAQQAFDEDEHTGRSS